MKLKCHAILNGHLTPKYARNFTSALLKKVASADQWSTTESHDNGFKQGNFTVKPFSHSQISGLKWDGEKFYSTDTVSFGFGWSLEIVSAFCEAVAADPVLRIGDTEMEIIKIGRIPDGGHVFRALSPIVVKDKTGYITPNNTEEFIKLLQINSVKKIEVLTGEKLRPEVVRFRFPKGLQRKIVWWGDMFCCLGGVGYVEIDSDPDIVTPLADVGLGCKTACGFGFVEAVA